jgi:hypothetical protein
MLAGWSRFSRLIGVACLAAVLAVADLLLSRGTFAPTVSPDAPRLLVLVVFDQLRGDYLERWHDLFGQGGFRRLQEEGAWFRNCHYPYAHTVTGAGHASLLTGCSPNRHGIVGNEWYQRDLGAPVYCVASDRDEQLPQPPERPGKESKRKGGRVGGASPERLLVPTVGDVLKDASAGRSRIVSLSFKDRSAVLPGGRQADACYWLDTSMGRFVTSTYYPRGRLHPWVAALNESRPADRWFGKEWTRLRPDLDYVQHSGPDDVEGEGKGYGQGRTFPHPLSGRLKTPGKEYYEALYNSPFGNEMLLELVKRAIDGEELGQRSMPDLLCVSFSCNDPIGHTWGPDSQEVLDVTLRSDLIVRDLLAYLDNRVGQGNYLLALTADHGVCPLPEVSQAKGIAAARLGSDMLNGGAEEFLAETFGKEGTPVKWIEATAEPWIFLDQKVMRDHGLKAATVEEKLADWLARQPGIQAAYTREQLDQPVKPDDDAILARMKRSFHPARCGEVAAVLKPFNLFLGPFSTGTTHGAPHPYDTHVPLLVYGPGITGGRRGEEVTPQAIAAIFADFLGIPPPAGAEAPVPQSLRAP